MRRQPTIIPDPKTLAECCQAIREIRDGLLADGKTIICRNGKYSVNIAPGSGLALGRQGVKLDTQSPQFTGPATERKAPTINDGASLKLYAMWHRDSGAEELHAIDITSSGGVFAATVTGEVFGVYTPSRLYNVTITVSRTGAIWTAAIKADGHPTYGWSQTTATMDGGLTPTGAFAGDVVTHGEAGGEIALDGHWTTIVIKQE